MALLGASERDIFGYTSKQISKNRRHSEVEKLKTLIYLRGGASVVSMGRAFNRLWAASVVSNLADGVLIAAAPLLAIKLTDSTILISIVGAMVMLPWLLFAIPIGAMVDRVDRRKILAFSNAFRAIVIGVLAIGIATGDVTIYWLIAAAFIIGVCEVANDTTAQSLIPQILEKEHYEKGNSRLQISETVVQGFIGSPLSGFLYALAMYLPFFINSIGYVVASLLALSIPIRYLQDVRTEISRENKPNFIEDMRFGINYLYNHKILRRLVLKTATIGVCYSMGTATMVLFIIKELRLEPKYFGVILTIQGLGALLGAIVAPQASKKFGRGIMMTLGIVGSSIILLLQGFAPNIYIFVALATLGGFAIAQWNILLMATYQIIIPNELYGRIHGTRRTLVWGMMPIGSIIGGVLAQYDLRFPLYVGGIIATTISLLSIGFFMGIAKNTEGIPKP